MSVEKQIYKILLIYTILISAIIAIVETILQTNFFVLFGFICGVITNALCFYISIFVLDKILYNPHGKIKLLTIMAYVIKLGLYFGVLYLIFISPFKWGVFSCGAGYVSIRMCIMIYYKIDAMNDQSRLINKLSITKTLEEKLMNHGINKTKDLCVTTKSALSAFLDEKEINEVSKALKKFNLHLKGELKVIEEDE
ncbi:MAG: hypothetical protein WCS56_02610 [Bacilli bacterium]